MGFDELVELAIEHSCGITGLKAGAVVLDQLIGMEHITSDLIAPTCAYMLPLQFCLFLRFSLQFKLKEPGAQNS